MQTATHTTQNPEAGSPHDRDKFTDETGTATATIPDPFDLEFDRFNSGAMADAMEDRTKNYPLEDLKGRPIDLEYELDRDDPEAVDLEALYAQEEAAAGEESPDEEEDILLAGREVDLDDEYDLMHDHALRVTEPSAHQPPGPTAGVHPSFEQVKNAVVGGNPSSAVPPSSQHHAPPA